MLLHVMPHVVTCSSCVWHFGLLLNGQTKCCNVARPFLVQQGQWSVDETSCIPPCRPLHTCLLLHSALCIAYATACLFGHVECLLHGQLFQTEQAFFSSSFIVHSLLPYRIIFPRNVLYIIHSVCTTYKKRQKKTKQCTALAIDDEK